MENGYRFQTDSGYLERDYSLNPLLSSYGAKPLALPIIKRDQWKDRIDEMDQEESSLYHIGLRHNVPVLNQGSVSYCHAFSIANAIMYARAAANIPFKLLSASSIGGPVTGFRNAGAYIFDDLAQAVKGGICEVDFYPMLTTQNHFTPEAKANALRHRVVEWWDLEPGNFDQTISCLLKRKPVCTGLNWWGHAVTFLKPIYRLIGSKIQFGVLFVNSWANWTGGGCTIPGHGFLWEGDRENATPDQQYCPLVTASGL